MICQKAKKNVQKRGCRHHGAVDVYPGEREGVCRPSPGPAAPHRYGLTMTETVHTPGRVAVLLTLAATAMTVQAPYLTGFKVGAAFFAATALFAWAVSVALSDRGPGLALTTLSTLVFVADIAVVEGGGSVEWINALTSIGVLIGFLSIVCLAAPEILLAENRRGKQTSARGGANTFS